MNDVFDFIIEFAASPLGIFLGGILMVIVVGVMNKRNLVDVLDSVLDAITIEPLIEETVVKYLPKGSEQQELAQMFAKLVVELASKTENERDDIIGKWLADITDGEIEPEDAPE